MTLEELCILWHLASDAFWPDLAAKLRNEINLKSQRHLEDGEIREIVYAERAKQNQSEQ